MDIEKKLLEVFSKKVSGVEVSMDSSLESLKLDSLDKIDLLYEIEDVFGIEFSDEEMQSFNKVGDLLELISTKVKK